MNRLKKAISVGMSAALLASLFTVIAAPAAFAATATGIVYGPNGSVAGSAVAASSTFAAFTPPTALAAGTTITLTLPTGTVLTTIAAGDFTVQQIGGAATAPTVATGAGTTITLTLAAASIGTTGNAVTIATSGGLGATDIVNPTAAGSAYTFSVATAVGDSGTLSGVTFIAGAAHHVAVTPAAPSIVVGATQAFTATCQDVNNNPTTGCGTITWTSGTPATATISSSTGVATGVAAGTSVITATPTAGIAGTTTLTVTTAPNSVVCTPGAGSIVAGSSVSCTATAGTGNTFLSWTASDFTPVASVTNPQAFVAGAAGAASIVANFSGAVTPITTSYTVTGAVIPPPSTTTDYTFTATGAGSVPTTGVSGAVSIAVGEHFATGWGAAGNTLTFTLTDSAGSGTTVKWTGTPAISGAPTSLGTFTVSGAASNVITVKFTASNTAQIENFTLSGMTITTDGAATGPLRVIVAKTAGAGTGTIPFGTGTASAILSGDVIANSTSIPYILDAGSFAFAPTNANNGNLLIAAPDAESRGISTGGNPLTLATVTGAFHADETVITQSVSIQGLLIAGTVVPTLTETAVKTTAAIQPGENNQVLTGSSVTIDESSKGTLAKASVVTFKLDTVGVLFSNAPTATPAGTALRLNDATADGTAVPCALSFDRTSCTVTVTKASTDAGGGTITLASMTVDVAATVAQGAKVGIDVSTSPAVPVNVDSKTIFTLNRFVVGVAAQPTIYINENDQQTGMLTLTEQAAGLLTAAAGNNYLGLCLSTGESFTRAPWAVVTAGDLLLRSGAVGATSVQGSIIAGTDNKCVEWIVYSKSKTASTIEIRGSDASNVVLPSGATNGPRLSVPAAAVPGATQIRVLNGSQANVEGNSAAALVTVVSNAVRAFRNQPVVAAVSQPVIPVGATDSLLGNLTITETLAGQFKAGEVVTVTIQPVVAAGVQQVTLFNTGTTAKIPLIGTNSASGLLTGPATFIGQTSFSFTISQQATGTLGVITISNMHVYTVAGATLGPILVRVTAPGALNPGVIIDQTVSNGRIGVAAAADAWIARGLNVRASSAFTLSTVVTKRGSYVTIRGKISGSAPGTLVGIWVKTKTTAWHLETSRRVSTNGYMYYSGHVNNLGYRYYRVAALGAISNTVRAFGK